MKSFFIGAAFGALALWGLQYLVALDSKKEYSTTQQSQAYVADTTNVVSATHTAKTVSQPLSEQQLRRIIQQEIHASLAEQFSLLRKESANNSSIAARDDAKDSSDATKVKKHSAADSDNNPMYQTVDDIVESAKYDGYFTPQSLAELRMHYTELTDAQKFEIDAKIADSVNSGSLQFDDALFIQRP